MNTKINQHLVNSKKFGKYLIEQLPNSIDKVYIYLGELTLTVKPKNLSKILNFLFFNNQCQFKILADITAIDYSNRKKRFELVYNLLSIKYRSRIRIKVETDELTPIQSASALFKSSIWLEREVWDMFGIYFQGNPDLRRILTDYGFEGHPMRKDFPLSGYLEIRYDEDSKRIIYENVELTQEFRYFNFNSPWENNKTK